MHKKPPPNIGKIPNPPVLRTGSSQVNQPEASTNANTDAVQLTYDDISNAIEGLQERRNGGGSSPQRVAAPDANAGYYEAQQSMPPRPPSVASSTLAGNESDPGVHAISKPLSGGPRSRPQLHSHLQSGYYNNNNSSSEKVGYDYGQSSGAPPILPTINSGEALDWGDLDVHPASGDPFVDGAAQESVPLQSRSQSQVYAQPPPPPPAMMGHSQQGSYAEYDGYDGPNAYARPPSAYPSTRPSSAMYSSYQPSSYQSGQPSPTDGRSSYYSQGYAHSMESHEQHSANSHTGLPTHYNAQGELIVDQYGPETGAYSSAVDTPPRHTMRSRSATPMGPGAGGEYVVLDEEGYDYDPSDQTHDPEKDGYDYEEDYEPAQYYNAGGNLGYNEKMTPITEYPETPVTTQHYGPVPVGRVTRRNKQKKRVQLTHGNLALDLPVPTKLVLPLRREEEMLSLRYTAVTCDPDDFVKNNFVLRQNLNGRSTEMFIVITMYNVGLLSFDHNETG